MASCTKLVVNVGFSDYFSLSDLIVDNSEPGIGETIHLDVNSASSVEGGTAYLYLVMDKDTSPKNLPGRTINIHAGYHSYAFTFTPGAADVGTHTLTACATKDNETVCSSTITITVTAPPPVYETSISISPTSINAGQAATIKATVTNIGKTPGQPTIYLEKNGQPLAGTEVASPRVLPQGGSFSTSWSYVPDESERGEEITFCVKVRE